MLRQREACRLVRCSFKRRLAVTFAGSVSEFEERKMGLHERQGRVKHSRDRRELRAMAEGEAEKENGGQRERRKQYRSGKSITKFVKMTVKTSERSGRERDSTRARPAAQPSVNYHCCKTRNSRVVSSGRMECGAGGGGGGRGSHACKKKEEEKRKKEIREVCKPEC